MRTMYKVEERVYTDCEGRSSDWFTAKNSTWVDTMGEAKAITATIQKKSGWDTGDWRIVKRTMDEATFTVINEIVAEYSWWKEVGRYKSAEENIVYHEQAIAELEASKERCRTANGIAKKDAEIACHKKMIDSAKAILAERK